MKKWEKKEEEIEKIIQEIDMLIDEINALLGEDIILAKPEVAVEA